MRKHGIALAAALALLGAAGPVWALGVGVGAALPTGDFNDTHQIGIGAHLVVDRPLAPTVKAYGAVGVTSFMGKEIGNTGVDYANIEIWNFSAGVQAGLGGLFAGLEGGYFTEVDEFGVTPFVGTGFGPLSVSARYKATGDANWFEVRAGFKLGLGY